jgi:predicted metal-dependent phosphoesterase TrpH
MRCDLHVHTIHSGMCTIPVLNRVCRECYNDPEQTYSTLKRRGMDLVTITDHDSIGAADCLSKYPDFFLSEEVTCRLPSRTEIHVGVYDITERDHFELQSRRSDFERLLAYLRERELFFSINHAFSALTGRRELEDFELFAAAFPAAEVLNGAMPARSNACALRWGRSQGKTAIAGSDSHALRGVGRTYTEIRGACDKADFLAGLRRGQTRVAGESGSWLKLTCDVLEIVGAMAAENPATRCLVPLAAAVPVVTLANLVREWLFSEHWMARVSVASARRVEAAEYTRA